MTDKPNDSLKSKSKSGKTVDKSVNGVEKSGKTLEPQKSRRGGKRPGAGRKKGKLEPQTIEKMKIKKQLEDRIAKNAHILYNAQVTLALGEQYLLKRYKIMVGKNYRWSRFERVTDPDEMIEYLDGKFKDDSNSVYYMLSAEKPDAKAIDSLLDRAFGRAPQNLNIKDDRPDPIAKILSKFGLLEDEGDSDDGQTEGSQGTTP
jgi:hypothetical protein